MSISSWWYEKLKSHTVHMYSDKDSSLLEYDAVSLGE